MQVCHGKHGPLRRLKPADVVVYYSPRLTFAGAVPCQSFTGLATVSDTQPYPVCLGGRGRVWRQDVTWVSAEFAPIRPLLDTLEFTTNRRSWGYQLRLGLVPVTDGDMAHIAAAMRAELPAPVR